jgi:hypothetical protein
VKTTTEPKTIADPVQKARELLGRARGVYGCVLSLEKALLEDRDRLLLAGFYLGALLSEMKDCLPHGGWLFWLGSNWKELGARNAQRCMAFFHENAKCVDSTHLKGIDSLLACEDPAAIELPPSLKFTADSIRKFMWGYVPEKERPQLEGDEPVKRSPHHLGVVNAFSKFERQLTLGHITASTDELRRDFAPVIPRLVELLGKDWFRSMLKED